VYLGFYHLSVKTNRCFFFLILLCTPVRLLPELFSEVQVILDLHPVNPARLAPYPYFQNTRHLHYMTRLSSERTRTSPSLLYDVEVINVACHRHRDHGLVLIYAALMAVVSETLIRVPNVAFQVDHSAIYWPGS